VTVEPPSIELEEFELVQAAPDTALLRVTARAPAAMPPDPTLLIDDGNQVHRVRPLPSPPDPEGWLRAAYSLRTEVLDRAPAFTLELWPGAFVELPVPMHRGRPALGIRAGTGPVETHTLDDHSDIETVIELEAAVIEANRTAAALQSEAERLRQALSAAEEAIQNADRAWEGVENSLASLRAQIDRDLNRLEEELRAARFEAAAAWDAERAARADAERLRIDRVKDEPEQVTEMIRQAAEDRMRSKVETEIRAALEARSEEI
jgi:hypothetical protein